MLYVQPPKVLDGISRFSGIDDARTLYCTLLNYDYQDLPIPIEDRSRSAKEILKHFSDCHSILHWQADPIDIEGLRRRIKFRFDTAIITQHVSKGGKKFVEY